MSNMEVDLKNGYTIRSMDGDEFELYWGKYRKVFFDDGTQTFRVEQVISESELKKLALLKGSIQSSLFSLKLGLFFEDQFVGWAFSRQEPLDSLYIASVGVLPEHRKKGLFSQLLQATLKEAALKGFQVVWTQLRASNNNMLISCLKAGFMVSGLDISDAYGTVVKVSLFTNKARSKVFDYRTGQLKPDDEIKEFLKLN